MSNIRASSLDYSTKQFEGWENAQQGFDTDGNWTVVIRYKVKSENFASEAPLPKSPITLVPGLPAGIPVTLICLGVNSELSSDPGLLIMTVI